MGWKKQEVTTATYVSLGDDEDSVKTFGGLLLKLEQNATYPNKIDYVTVKKSGEVVKLSGSASLARQLGAAHVGQFFKADFVGWGKSANGKFKEIAVHLWDGDLTPEMQSWPMLAEARQNAKGEPKMSKSVPPKPKAPEPPDDFSDVPPALEHDPDDLPF
jgi:hypothetical protein